MITTQVSNQEIFVTAVSIARALKVKAPVAAIPLPGHSPLCFHRTKLAAALKGVTPVSITCEVGTCARYLVIKGHAGSVKTSFRAVALDVREARKLVTAWASRQRVKKSAPAKVKPTADTFQGDSPEAELENALRSLESFRHQIRRNLFPHSSYESASPAKFAAWHKRKAERTAINTPIYALGKQYTKLTARIQELACSRVAHTKAEAKEFSSLQKERHAVEVERNKALRARDRAIKATPDLMKRPRLVAYLNNERPSASELVEILQRIAGAKSIIVALAVETGNTAVKFAMAEDARQKIVTVRDEVRKHIRYGTTSRAEIECLGRFNRNRAERLDISRRFSDIFKTGGNMAKFQVLDKLAEDEGRRMAWVHISRPTIPTVNPYGWNGSRETWRRDLASTLRNAKKTLRMTDRITAELTQRIAQQVAA